MPSFDIVSECNMVEMKNSVDQANKEIHTRFDFKGSSSNITLSENNIILNADNDFQLTQMKDILLNKMAKRTVDIRVLGDKSLEKVSGNKLKETIQIKNGIDQVTGKKIIKFIKDMKIKITSSINDDTVRVTGSKKDDLQHVMEYIKPEFADISLQFINFRD